MDHGHRHEYDLYFPDLVRVRDFVTNQMNINGVEQINAVIKKQSTEKNHASDKNMFRFYPEGIFLGKSVQSVTIQ